MGLLTSRSLITNLMQALHIKCRVFFFCPQHLGEVDVLPVLLLVILYLSTIEKPKSLWKETPSTVLKLSFYNCLNVCCVFQQGVEWLTWKAVLSARLALRQLTFLATVLKHNCWNNSKNIAKLLTLWAGITLSPLLSIKLKLEKSKYKIKKASQFWQGLAAWWSFKRWAQFR